MSAQQTTNTQQLQERNFLYIEQAGNPLKRVDNAKILQNMIDPTTGQIYGGGEAIVLEGEFASMSVLNNNNRIYSEENYIGFIEELKKKAWSADGLYGEYEHPKSYATDGKNVSHKILDIWYDRDQKKVFGIVLLLNTTNGKEAQEIIRSGGRLGISARAGGKEIKNPNGTITATISLMVTFDLVWHPGFTTAKLGLTNLNESAEPAAPRLLKFTIYEDNLEELDGLYETYRALDDRQVNFLEWVGEKKLFESAGPDIDQQQEQAQQRLQNGQNNNEEQSEQQLEDAVDQQLNENQGKFYQAMQNAQIGLGRKMKNAAKATGKFKKQGNSLYDGSAGFVANSGNTGSAAAVSAGGLSQDDDGFNLDKQIGFSDAEGTGFMTEMYDENPYAATMANQSQELEDDPYGFGDDDDDELDEDFGGADCRPFNGSGDHPADLLQQQKLYQRQFTAAKRKELAEAGQALPDGSFPIVTEEDLRNAISTCSLSKDVPRAKKWIKKRASALGKADMIPKSWL